MVSKKVISTKISEHEYERLDLISRANGMSVSAVMKLMVSGLLSGDIEIEQGEIKVAEPVATFDEEFTENIRYKELRFDRLLRAFEKNEYPDSAIRQYIEQIASQVDEQGKFSKKKYRDDWGC